MTELVTDRPDPDALLKRVQAEERRERRAKLRIYLGYAPGVGKTYTMLEAARELRGTGTNVVIGLVETHGRYDTGALVLGLEVLPRRRVEYRGRSLEEFDLDAALARKPQLLLLDELAHTNAPGSRHSKRWQDVVELLDSGIDVHTTLNVQHVESLNDVVAQITTIRVRETVPDAILDRADEIELVDLPPSELLIRLKQGKVYFPAQAERAAQNFFQRGNLLALRELSLRKTADRVDVDVLAHRQEHEINKTWATTERILVCIGPSPASARLARAAHRMAAGLRAPWVAAYVESTRSAPLSEAARDQLEANLRLVESLGGEVVRLDGSRVSEVLIDYARRNNVTRLVIGKPTHSRVLDLFKESFLGELVRGSGDIDVHVISGDGQTIPENDAPTVKSKTDWAGHGWATALVTCASIAAGVGRSVFELPDVAMLYLAVIVIVAARFGRGSSILAAALSVAAYDFFFIKPYLTFSVADTRHLLTFAMMFGIGLFISGLTLRIRRQEQSAREREARTAALYALSRKLRLAVDDSDAAQALAEQVATVFDCGAAVLLCTGTEDLTLEEVARVGDIALETAELAVLRWVAQHGDPAGLGTETLRGARIVGVPLISGASVLGALALLPKEGRELRIEERDLLDAFVRQGALAIERARLAKEAERAVLRARTEEMRSSLLSAVSHDLRTPLGAITGAATTLRDDSGHSLSALQQRDLTEAICEEAERLERLVGNLLDMTRLESGHLRVKREWVPLEEVIGSALTRLETKLQDRPVLTALAENLPLLFVDPVLFEQVFINLFENAAKYAAPGAELKITAEANERYVVIEVADRGPGIVIGDETKVFEKFYRGAHVGIGGVGLGLPICRGIVEAHGGTIRVENRSGGGAVFRITLPLLEPSPAPSKPESANPGNEARP